MLLWREQVQKMQTCPAAAFPRWQVVERGPVLLRTARCASNRGAVFHSAGRERISAISCSWRFVSLGYSQRLREILEVICVISLSNSGGPWISSVRITWERVSRVNSQFPSQTDLLRNSGDREGQARLEAKPLKFFVTWHYFYLTLHLALFSRP